MNRLQTEGDGQIAVVRRLDTWDILLSGYSSTVNLSTGGCEIGRKLCCKCKTVSWLKGASCNSDITGTYAYISRIFKRRNLCASVIWEIKKKYINQRQTWLPTEHQCPTQWGHILLRFLCYKTVRVDINWGSICRGYSLGCCSFNIPIMRYKGEYIK